MMLRGLFRNPFQLPKNYLDKKNPPVVIVGAGLAGSLAALRAHENGHKVLVVTKHPYPARSQRVRLRLLTINFLRQFQTPGDEDDINFFEKIEMTGGLASIKSIEKYCARKMKDANIPVLDDTAGELTGIDTKKHTISLQLHGNKKRTQVPFRHVVDASGTSRVVFNMIKNQEEVNIKPLGSPFHAAQGAVTFVLPPGMNLDPKSINPVTTINFTDETKLQELGWKDGQYEKYNYPKGYIFSNHEYNKFYLAGEIPSSYFDPALSKEEAREKIIEWYKTIICNQFNLQPDQLTVLNKSEENRGEKYLDRFGSVQLANRAMAASNELAVSRFKIKLDMIENPIIDLDEKHPGKHLILAIGDANESPYYHKVHGANDAIYSGVMLADDLLPKDPKQPNLEHFKKVMGDQREDYLENLIPKNLQPNVNEDINNFENDNLEEENDLLTVSVPAKKGFSPVRQFIKKHSVLFGITAGLIIGGGIAAVIFTAGLAAIPIAAGVFLSGIIVGGSACAGGVLAKTISDNKIERKRLPAQAPGVKIAKTINGNPNIIIKKAHSQFQTHPSNPVKGEDLSMSGSNRHLHLNIDDDLSSNNPNRLFHNQPKKVVNEELLIKKQTVDQLADDLHKICKSNQSENNPFMNSMLKKLDDALWELDDDFEGSKDINFYYEAAICLMCSFQGVVSEIKNTDLKNQLDQIYQKYPELKVAMDGPSQKYKGEIDTFVDYFKTIGYSGAHHDTGIRTFRSRYEMVPNNLTNSM